jgi:hypothetical protein
MSAPPLTRRRALALAAAGGLSTTLTRLPSTASAAVARPSAHFALDLPRTLFSAGRRTPVLRAPRRFDLLGLRGRALAGTGLQVRVRARGAAWSRWVPLGTGATHRPDRPTGATATDPVWAGAADELQLRWTRRPTGALRVHFVAVRAVAHAAARTQASTLPGAPAIIPRAAWGGDTVAPRSSPSYGDVQLAFVHHTVTANAYTAADSAAIVLGIARYHRDVNGWNDLGYNFLVDRFGQIFEGRAGGIDQAVVGAQSQGWNSHSTGIATLGTFDAEGPTEAALDAMASLIAWKLPLHGVPVTGQVVVVSGGGSANRYARGTPVTFERISGHRDGCATDCPGTQLYAQLPGLRERTAVIAPAVVPVAAAAVSLDAPAAPALPYGQDVIVGGHVTRPDGTPVAGQRVLVQKNPAGSAAWTTVARVDTGPDGAWVAAVGWRAAGRLRARAAVPGAPEAFSPIASIGCLPVLSAAAKAARVRAGRRATVSGTVRPAGAVAVTVERQGSDGRWRRTGAVTVRPQGQAFRARVTLARAGLYRLTPRTGSGAAAATAAALYVRAVRPGASLVPAG